MENPIKMDDHLENPNQMVEKKLKLAVPSFPFLASRCSFAWLVDNGKSYQNLDDLGGPPLLFL